MPFAPIWRRLIAFLIDCILLGLLLMVIGLAFTDWLAVIGNWGRLITLSSALVYFGVLDSSDGGGQTFGKKFLKIEVRATDCSLPSLRIGMIRSLPIAVMISANGMVTNIVWIDLIFSFAWSSFALLLLYMTIFYRKQGRLPQDLLAGTVVVMDTVRYFDVVESKRWLNIGIIACVLIALVVGIYQVRDYVSESARNSRVAWGGMQEKLDLNGAILNIQKVTINNQSHFAVNVVVNNKKFLSEVMAARVVNAIFWEGFSGIPADEKLTVNLGYGFNLGLVQSVSWTSFQHTQAEWAALVD
ncbi:RDD family protein [Aquitalea pelogenes]|uniref:RDD family protein n=1 Tax=Aquitalea pelogenes TaxID=1293573 RepID=UPI000787A19B|nr:RDD family protein [Aquitalea pelogenes]